jgi:isopentenyl phosphate kinase
MLTFIKLGGSLITDKRVPNSFRAAQAAAVARVIADARTARPHAPILLGHGSGSFGHVAARKYGTMSGVSTPDAWRGFAEVAAAASVLNTLMLDTLRDAGVAAVRFQPSASARARDGVLEWMATDPIVQAVHAGLVPLVYGDVAFDTLRGGTIISTEALFFYLVGALNPVLPVARIVLLGEVEGVYDASGAVIDAITPLTLASVEAALGGSSGTDVTGGMETKVRDMVALVEHFPSLEIRIMDGRTPDGLARVLADAASPGEALPGTRIHSGQR